MSEKRMSGVILAGGNSRRMGRDKGLIMIKGMRMVEIISNRIRPYFDELMIISNNKAYGEFGIRLVGDLIKGKGPLSGIYSGLSASNTFGNVFLSCDNPAPSIKLIQKLSMIGNKRPVVYEFEGEIQPFPGYYSKMNLDYIEERISENKLSVLESIDGLNAEVMKWSDWETSSPLNINTPEQLKAYERN